MEEKLKMKYNFELKSVLLVLHEYHCNVVKMVIRKKQSDRRVRKITNKKV
jgi:hypothetical protein